MCSPLLTGGGTCVDQLLGAQAAGEKGEDCRSELEAGAQAAEEASRVLKVRPCETHTTRLPGTCFKP
eukprot:283696-Pyramimonas_sp.AAC.1